MKTINTIIISGLVAVSLNTPVLASSLDAQMQEMNRVLDNRIERQIRKIDDIVNREIQVRVEKATADASTGAAALSAAHLVRINRERS